jgi:GT2 family glycosyltransferase
MISIVIVSYRSTSVLAQCLRALLSEIDGEDEVIVIENSQDHRVQELPEFNRENFTLVLNEKNVGYSKGCNQGIQMASKGQVLLLNPDTLPKTGAINALKNSLKTREKHALYVVELVNPDGSRQDYYRRFPSVRALLVMFFVPSSFQSHFRAYQNYTYSSDFLSRNSFEQPPGAGLVVPKTAKLDEDFFVYGSDLMLCWEFAENRNEEVELLPVQFVHFRGQGGTSSSPELADWLRVESARGFAMFYSKSGQRFRQCVWVFSFGFLEFCGFLRFVGHPMQRARRKKRLCSFLWPSKGNKV